MELFKTIGSALSFSNSDSKQSAKQEASPKQQQQQTSGSVLGGPAGAGGSSSSPSSAVKANPFGAAFSDAGIAAARGSPKRKGSTGATTTSSKSAASPKKGSSSGSIGGGKAKSSSASPKASKSSSRGEDGGAEDHQREPSEEADTLSGGVEKALNSFSRTISRSLSFKSNSSPKETSTDKKKTSGAAAPQVVPPGAATFSKFDVSLEEELAKKAAATASANASAEPRSQAASGLPRARSVTFGTPATSLSTMKDSAAAATRARGTQQDPFDGQLPTALTAEQKEKLEREALTLQGTSRVKYHGTSVVQGNTIHFVVVAVVVGSFKAVDGGGKPQPNYSMALIGLLDPLGTVRASTKATVERCDAIRKLERVRISPREADLASLGAGGGSASSSGGGGEKKAGSAGSVLLVDPAQASVLGVLVPFLRRVGGVSAVDGFKADYWTASDAAGTHRVPLFDVEGPIDDLNNIAVLRLRCHTLKVEDALLPGATRADVATQTLNDAKALLHDDFEDELDSLRKDHRHEIDVLRHEVAKLQQQLDWKVSETKELTASSRAKEDAMTTEIAELKRQLSMRIVATQTDNGLRRKAAAHRGEDDGRSDDTMSTSAATEEPESRSASTPPPHDASANHTNKSTLKKNASAETNTTATLRTAATLETIQSDSRNAHQYNEPVPLTRDALYEIHHGSTPAGSGAAAQQQGNPVNASKPRQHHHHNNSVAVYEPIPRAADYSTAMGRERVPQAFGTPASTDHVRAWDTSLDSRLALASPHSKPVAADDPLAQVRAKLARSEAFLKQARTGGSSTAVPTTPTVVGPGVVVALRSTQLHHHASSSSPLEAFSSWEASAIHSTASIRSPAQILRQLSSATTSARDPGNAAPGGRRLY